MQRYAAFLRGVMPVNCRMADLRKAFEAAGFTDVKTILASGNVVFSAPAAGNATLERKAEQAMAKTMGRSFLTIVRPVDDLVSLLASDPYRRSNVDRVAKRIVTFLKTKPRTKLKLPIELHGAVIAAQRGSEVFSAYLPTPKGPAFMKLIEDAYGKDQTTRTWQTVEKAAR